MIELLKADFAITRHCDDYVRLLNEYAIDVMGGGTALKPQVLENLPTEIAQRETITVILAYDHDQAIGLVTCIEGFSSFQCRPLMNIHDVYVVKKYRGKGVSTKLLNLVQQHATDKNCCKLTLEVLQGNRIAKIAYHNFGFKDYELDPEVGNALFWEKSLD